VSEAPAPRRSPASGARGAVLTSLAAALLVSPTLWWPGVVPAGFDASALVVPLLRLAGDIVAAGDVPTWTDAIGAGFPLAGSMQAPLLYPPGWLLLALDDPAAGLGAFLFSHLVVAGAGGALLARRFGVSRVGAGVAAVLMAASAPVVGLLNRPEFLVALSWSPWVYAAVTTRGTRRDRGLMLGMALGLTASVSPQMALAHVLVAVALHLLVTRVDRHVRVAGRDELLSTVAWSLVVAGPTLSLFVALVPLSDRILGVAATASTRFAVGVEQVPQLLSPMLLGLTPLGVELGDVGAYRYAHFLWVSAPLAGTAALLALVAAARFARGRRLLVLVVAGFVLASPHTFPGVGALWSLPPLSLFRYTGKAWTAVLPLAVLMTAMGVDGLRRAPRRAWAVTVAACVVVAAAALLPSSVWRAAGGIDDQTLAADNAAALGSWTCVLAAVVLAMSAAAMRRGGRRGHRMLAAVVVVEALGFGHGALRTLDTTPRPSSQVARALAALVAEGDGRAPRVAHAPRQARTPPPSPRDPQVRFEADVALGLRNQLLGDGVALDVAHLGVRLADAHRLYQATRHDPRARVAALGSEALWIGDAWSAPPGYAELLRADEHHLVLYRTGDGRAPRVARRLVGAASPQQQMAALQRPDLDLAADAVVIGAAAAGGDASVSQVERRTKRVAFTIEAEAPRLVWTPDSLTPAWAVTVDGAPSAPVAVHGALRGVVVPAGRHEVVWQHRETALLQGVAASLLGAALAAALRRRRQRHRAGAGGR
jgi:hypothetical protein